MTDWDRRFMDLAEYIAQWSKERGSKVGVVIVGPDKEIRSTGFNGFPRGVNDDIEERHGRENGQKYIWSSHAEINAICNANLMGVSVRDCTMYIPWYPCINCTKALIQAGISTLVAYEPDFGNERWGEEFGYARTMLSESGVKVRFIPRKST